MSKKTVLIIEDNRINREMLATILSDEYDVLKAENGKEGLEVLEKERDKVALIFLDIQMPVMDGYEFLEALKNSGEKVDIPIIMVTSTTSTEEQIRCFDLGASDFVTKPYNPDIIKKRCESLIRLRDTSALLYKAERDSLSGIYNRDAFYSYVQKYMDKYPNKTFDMICMVVDSYRLLSSRYGVERCEAFIKDFADELTGSIGIDAVIGRIDDDQIALFTEHLPFGLHNEYFNKVCDALRGNTKIPNAKINCGIYANVDTDVEIANMVNNAKIPIDSICDSYDTNIAIFNDEMRNKLLREQQIKGAARQAIEEKQFIVYYQPKHESTSEKVVGAEALVRWIHPDFGFISPGDFIPIFEKNGFVTRVDKYVLETVCADLRRMIDEGKKVVPVSINVSQVDFDHSNLVEEVERIVDENNIPHEYIHFEVTESVNAKDIQRKTLAINQFKEKGFNIELDDFGAGYSNMSTLGSLPIDVMKLDMALVQNMFEPKHKTILETILMAAHGLDLVAVAEGVETEEQLRLLRDMTGGRVKMLIQGFFFSKPLPVNEFEEYIDGRI